jgi:hypothetical protein
MTTVRFRRASLAVAATVGLLMGEAACGSNASDMATARHSAPRALQDDAPSAALSSQRARPDVPPTRPTTKEACDACQGLWAAHGIEPVETCICKTNDEGRDCLDGNDCQGECLLADDAEFHVMDRGDPARGYYRGHCASYDTTFGCFRHIPDAIGSELPLAAEDAGPLICVD